MALKVHTLTIEIYHKKIWHFSLIKIKKRCWVIQAPLHETYMTILQYRVYKQPWIGYLPKYLENFAFILCYQYTLLQNKQPNLKNQEKRSIMNKKVKTEIFRFWPQKWRRVVILRKVLKFFYFLSEFYKTWQNYSQKVQEWKITPGFGIKHIETVLIGTSTQLSPFSFVTHDTRWMKNSSFFPQFFFAFLFCIFGLIFI